MSLHRVIELPRMKMRGTGVDGCVYAILKILDMELQNLSVYLSVCLYTCVDTKNVYTIKYIYISLSLYIYLYIVHH